MKGHEKQQMFKKFVVLGAALLASSCFVFAADASLLQLVPADLNVIGGVNIDRAANSPFGQYVLSQVKDGDNDFREFVAAAGFDPRRDLREVVFASPAAGQHSPGVVLARGVFNGPQILAAVQAKGHGGTVTTYNGVSLLEKDGHSIGFVDGSLAVAGQSDLVRAALDRRSGTPAASALSAKASAAQSQFDAWMVTSGVFIAPMPRSKGSRQARANPVMPNLQGILETSGGLKFGTLIEFSAQALTRSNQDAQALSDVVKFLASMVQMNGDKNPDVAPMLAILQSLNVTTDGATVRLSFSIPEQELEKLVGQKGQARAAVQ